MKVNPMSFILSENYYAFLNIQTSMDHHSDIKNALYQKGAYIILGMDRIAVLPDIRPTGYPAILKTGYRIFRCSTELLK